MVKCQCLRPNSGCCRTTSSTSGAHRTALPRDLRPGMRIGRRGLTRRFNGTSSVNTPVPSLSPLSSSHPSVPDLPEACMHSPTVRQEHINSGVLCGLREGAARQRVRSRPRGELYPSTRQRESLQYDRRQRCARNSAADLSLDRVCDPIESSVSTPAPHTQALPREPPPDSIQ